MGVLLLPLKRASRYVKMNGTAEANK